MIIKPTPGKPYQEECVPLHEAKVPCREQVHLYSGQLYDLEGDRRVEVFRVRDEDGGGIAIRIFRPTTDDQMSKLFFGLSREAAEALHHGLTWHLSTHIIYKFPGETKPPTDAA